MPVINKEIYALIFGKGVDRFFGDLCGGIESLIQRDLHVIAEYREGA